VTPRFLPVAEWPRLTGTLLDPAWQGLDPATDRVIVIEDAVGAIVACSALIHAYHLEGTWVAPAWRGSVAVGRHLLRAQRALLTALHIPEVYMMARTPATAALCQKFGRAVLHLDCAHFLVTV
jgi:hypothetical protein